jgi:phosphatidylinositol alpha-1,6-mannosyltransferase
LTGVVDTTQAEDLAHSNVSPGEDNSATIRAGAHDYNHLPLMDILASYDFLPAIGGAHTWMYEQYRRWPTPVHAVAAQPSRDPRQAGLERAFDALDHGALTIHRLAPLGHPDLLDPRYWVTCLRQVRALASLGPISCLHAVRAFPEGFAALLCRRTLARRARLVTYAHGEEVLVARTSRQFTRMARTVYAASDLVIANSQGTRQLVAGLCPEARITCISPGVDVKAFVPDAEDVGRYRRTWGWPDDTMVVATVARMEPRKNHAMVLEAVASLRNRGVPVAYFCAGDGEERARLAERAITLGVQEWVRFPGAISDSEKKLAFAACQVHAMPAIRVGPMIEGFGIVFIEAAAAGVPSIAGNTGGQAEAVKDGETGLVVDGTSLAAVSGALEVLYRDGARRARMGTTAREWARQHDWTRIADAAHARISSLRAATS